MREIDKYGVLKEKLQGICDENGLTYSIQNQKYPFLMVIKPLGGVDAQQTMIEGIDNGGAGYISPDASLVFAYNDGDLSYKISETWTISENLFNKLKNLFKKMHSMWMQYFFRDVMECGAPSFGSSESDPEPVKIEVDGDAFAEFMAEAEPAVDGEE
jgi:hypothetical protein